MKKKLLILILLLFMMIPSAAFADSYATGYSEWSLTKTGYPGEQEKTAYLTPVTWTSWSSYSTTSYSKSTSRDVQTKTETQETNCKTKECNCHQVNRVLNPPGLSNCNKDKRSDDLYDCTRAGIECPSGTYGCLRWDEDCDKCTTCDKTTVTTYSYRDVKTWSDTNGAFTFTKPSDGFYKETKVYSYPLNYTIKYDANGGIGTMANQEGSCTSSTTLNANKFTRTGYIYQGWATSKTGSVVVNDKAVISDYTKIGAAPGGTTTLYAVWKPITYTVKYDGSDATRGTISNSTHTYDVPKALNENEYQKKYTVVFKMNGGTGISGTSDITRISTYEFLGWSLSKTGTVKFADNESVVNLTDVDGAVVNLFAKWKANAIQYGSNEEPYKKDYTFVGWGEDPSKYYGTYVLSEDIIPSEDIELYALWVKTPTLTLKENTYFLNDHLTAATLKENAIYNNGILSIESISEIKNGAEKTIATNPDDNFNVDTSEVKNIKVCYKVTSDKNNTVSVSKCNTYPITDVKPYIPSKDEDPSVGNGSGSTRFIDEKQTGIDDDSIWKKNSDYRKALEDALNSDTSSYELEIN